MAKEDDESISIDMSYVKKGFGKTNKSVKSFWSKKQNRIITMWVLIALIIFISAWYRAYPASLPITEDWVFNSIQTNVKNQIASQVRGERTGLTDAAISAEVNAQWADYYKQNKASIDEQIRINSQQFRDQMQDANGQTYLLAIDPYLWYSYAKWYDRNGFWGTDIVDGKPRFMIRNGNVGQRGSFNMPAFAIIVVHSVVSVFDSAQDIFTTSFWMPPILIGLAIIPAFFLGKKIGGMPGGFFAAIIFALSTPILGRTSAGFSDTDAYTFIFPFLIVWLFLESIEAKKTKNTIILAALTGLSLVLFKSFWGGWWFTADLILGLSVIFIFYKGLGLKTLYLIFSRWRFARSILDSLSSEEKRKNWFKDAKPGLIFLGIFIVSALLFSLLYLGAVQHPNIKGEMFTFMRAPLEPVQFVLGFKGAASEITFGQGGSYPLWPNVFTTVAELNPGNQAQVIAGGGGWGLVIAALIGIVALFFKKVDGKRMPLYGILLAFWFASTYYAGFIGQRFIALFAPVVAFGIAGLIGMLIVLIKYLSKKGETFTSIIMMTLFAYILTYIVGLFININIWIHIFIALAVGLSTGKIVIDSIKKESKDDYRDIISNLAIGMVFVALILIIIIPQMMVANAVAKSEVPSYDDTWEKAMLLIKDSSDKAVISSWWDFGHWFQARSERSVTFDGGDQGKRIHWIGQTLLTDDEDEAVDILKMLNCGQENSYNLLLDYQGDKLQATRTLKEIIRMERDDAQDYLIEQGLSESESSDVLEESHCEDFTDMYYITSGDMVGKSSVWGHFGSWDFDRAYAYYRIKNLPIQEALQEAQDKLGMTEDEAKNLFVEVQKITSENQANAWISPWPSYITGAPASCSENQEVIRCEYNLNMGQQRGVVSVLWLGVINKTDINSSFMIARAIDQNTGSVLSQNTIKPRSIVVYDEDEIERHDFEKSGIDIDVVLFKNPDGKYQTLLTHPLLSESLFTKLFFLDGATTEHFEKVFDERDFRNLRIIVYKVNP